VSRGPKKWTEDIINRMELEGYGKGEGADYKPWLSVHTFSSMGRSHRVLGIKTGREHHLFSDVEWRTFLFLEWAREVVDIREQFPLDRALTLEIAATNQLRHPYYPGTHVPTVMTVDFLVTCEINGEKFLQVYDCKRAEDSENENALQKLEIQRQYFDGIGAAYNLVLHSKLPKTKVQNLEWIRSALLKPEEQEPFPGFFLDASQRLVNELSRDRKSEPLNTYST